MTIEHIYFDLDGTLIGSTGDVKPSVWAAIDALRGKIGMSVCTGRTAIGVAVRVAERLDPTGRHIFENGAMTCRADGTEVSSHVLSDADTHELAVAAQLINATVEFYTTDGIFVSRLDDDCREHAEALGIEPIEADLFEVAKRGGVFRAHWIMREPVVDQVREVELSDAEVGFASSPVLPQMVFASVTRDGVSKGSAAREHAERHGLDLANCIAIGDAPGDISILEAVGHPYVMANSPDSLLHAFDALEHVDGRGVEPLLESLR